MQYALMAVRGLCHTACHTAANQQRDEAEALPAEPCIPPSSANTSVLMRVGSMGPMPIPTPISHWCK